MSDVWEIVVSLATALSALFLFLNWYNGYQIRKDMILVTRFTEANRFYLRVTPKRDNILDKCTVLFDNQPILTKDTHKPQTILRGALNFEFWANNPPANLDERLIVVKNKGKTIFKSKFNELDSDD